MRLISFHILCTLLVLQYSQGIQPTKKKDSSLFSTKITSKQDAYFLYKIKLTSQSGRFFNQSIDDFEKLEPSCPCVHPSASSCDSECCFCQLECQVPENPFTKTVSFPSSTKSCFANAIKEKTLSNGQKEKRPLFPWLCERTDDMNGYTSRLARFFCIYDINLQSVKIHYDINTGRTDMEMDDAAIPKYNWKSNFIHKNQVIKSVQDKLMENRENLENCSIPMGSQTGTMNTKLGTFHVGSSINFTTENDVETGYNKFVIINQPGFSFKSLPICSSYAAGRSLHECIYYFINASSLRNCDREKAVNITTQIVSFILTNGTTNVTFMNEDRLDKSRLDNDECFEIPNRGIITEVFHRKSVIGVFVNFTQKLSRGDVLESLTLSYNRVYVSNKELPRFWEEFFYGECPQSYCWRDLGKIGSIEVWRLSGLDDILQSNVVLLILPFIPLIVFLYLNDSF